MNKGVKKVLAWLARNNEFTFVIGLIILIWILVPPLFKLFDPQVGEFSIEILYIPLIAGIYFFIALLFIWLYLKLVFPKGFKILDDLFKNSEYNDPWDNTKILLRLFGWLVVLFSASLLAVTGISAIL